MSTPLAPTGSRLSNDSQPSTGSETPSPRGMVLPDNIRLPTLDGHQVLIPKNLSSNACERTQNIQLNVSEVDSIQIQMLINRLKQHSYGVSLLPTPSKKLFLNVMMTNKTSPSFDSEDFNALLGEHALLRI